MTVRMELPDDLVARLALVVADVEATAGVDLSFRDEGWSDSERTCWVEDESGSECGIGFFPIACAEEVALLADQIQEVVMETRWSQRINPAAWPECPTHRTHPLQAIAEDGAALWRCPKDASISFGIGSLG